MQLVGQTADRAFQRFKLLIQIGAQAFKLCRFGKVFGPDHLVMIGLVHQIIRVRVRGLRRGGRLHRGVAIGHLGLFAKLLIGGVIHRHLRLRFILLLLL